MRKAFGSAEGEWPAGVTEGLHEQLAGFARIPPGPVESAHSQPATDDDPRVAELDKMPQEVRTEAEEFLRDPRLLERVAEDITALGVVGENENKLILYLVGTSAQLPRPLAAITRGASSSGKSFLTEQVAKMFPPEVVLNATSLTTNALYYFESGTLRHRWVVAGERSRREDDETAEATRALREMIEAGKLAKAVPVKVGEWIVTQLIEQPGPIAYTETTTLGEVFEEDQNRCLILSTDEGDGQTRLVLEATALAAAGRSSPDAERVRQRHYAVQRMIPQVDVVIPFAGAVAEHYPRGRVECRREFRHLLQLVKASALLHHLQRERDAAGSVVANLDDYKVAERLARNPTYFGLVTETVVTDPGRSGRFVIQCSNNGVVDADFTTTEDVTGYPGSLVVIEEQEEGDLTLHRIRGDNKSIEVWYLPVLEQVLVYDAAVQHAAPPTKSWFWVWRKRDWIDHGNLQIWPQLVPLAGLDAAKAASDYRNYASSPPSPAASGLMSLLERLRNPGKPEPKPIPSVEVTIFTGTPRERRFTLPAMLSPERITRWVKEVETTRERGQSHALPEEE